HPKPLSLNACQATLSAGEAMVQYALLPDESFALVVTPKTARIVNLGPTDELREIAESFERAARRPDERGIIQKGKKSFAYLTRRIRRLAIEPLGLGKDVRRLLISPDGRLAYVPFAAVVLDLEIVFIPSATTYQALAAERDKRGDRVLALGDVVYDVKKQPDLLVKRGVERGGRFEPLLESGPEARAVGDVVLLNHNATIAGLRAALPGSKRWRAVHFACHGHIDAERPVLSLLALTPGADDDGYLRCLDVFRMKIPADLAVLSACRTGKGKVYRAEGVVGFTRAFLFAGTPRVIVSVWTVPDETSRPVMEKFYELWKGTKMSAATALRKAQDHVRSKPKWKHPYFWAAWQLWGLPD
ncbi:MAG: CHAT domain-containing protein, partial [Planctomycetota bacterium]|nr:CHAT domain-containing protein [Planctomycetota bacterium]